MKRRSRAAPVAGSFPCCDRRGDEMDALKAGKKAPDFSLLATPGRMES
jgi:hypothetical protein